MLVVFPGIQIGSEAPTPGLKPYTAQQLRGRHVYIEQGCLYCHSQQPRSADQAPDDERGWGRASLASDCAYDHPHLMGTMRPGPDLPNVDEIGRAHVCTKVTNAHIVCRLLLDNKSG